MTGLSRSWRSSFPLPMIGLPVNMWSSSSQSDTRRSLFDVFGGEDFLPGKEKASVCSHCTPPSLEVWCTLTAAHSHLRTSREATQRAEEQDHESLMTLLNSRIDPVTCFLWLLSKWNTKCPHGLSYCSACGLSQGSANFFCKGSDSKYFHFCGLYDLCSTYVVTGMVARKQPQTTCKWLGFILIKLDLHNWQQARFGPQALVC